MIWLIIFPFILMLRNKIFFYLTSTLDFCSLRIFISSISSLFVLVIRLVIFKDVILKINYIEFLSFLTLILMVTLRYYFRSPILFFIILELTIPLISRLIIWLSKDQDKIVALVFMVLINLAGSVPFIIFFTQFDIQVLEIFFLKPFFIISRLWELRFLLVLVSKLPIFILHFWLTKAHVRASGCCSIILAGLILKLASFGLTKIIPCFFIRLSISLIYSSMSYGMIFMVIIIRRFFDLKYVVASSSIVHIRPILFIVYSLRLRGVVSSIYLITRHGIVSFVLFILVTFYYESLIRRSSRLGKGIESCCKTLTIFIFTFLFINIGLPPVINFLRELLMFIHVVNISIYISLSIFFVILISIVYVINFCTSIIFGKIINFSNLNSNIGMTTFIIISYLARLIVLPFLF